MRFLVTGGAGFIGSALVRYIVRETADSVVNVDKLTYAGNLAAVAAVSGSARYAFEKADICDPAAMARVFATHQPDIVIHLAAESHVDRSIDGPAAFMQTNILGTFTLLEVARGYWQSRRDALPLSSPAGGPEDAEGHHGAEGFRFLHVSTDEVYGDLGDAAAKFTETSPYAPSSPYAASKASADHLVRAWRRTYGVPTLITNCSNNYGPYQYPEKLIPLMILNALAGKPLPIYGQGNQVRDWLYVEDHARALYAVATQGKIGETYNIGGGAELPNLAVVRMICELLEETAPAKPAGVARYADLITHVADRPGHDIRYALNDDKLKRELAWAPTETFASGLRKTVAWYVENRNWGR